MSRYVHAKIHRQEPPLSLRKRTLSRAVSTVAGVGIVRLTSHFSLSCDGRRGYRRYSMVHLCYETISEPNISKCKSNITKSDTVIMEFSFL